LVSISPQLPEFLRELKAQRKLRSPILYDAGNSVAERFGLAVQLPDDLIEVCKRLGVDLAKFNGDQLWRLPIPARIALDKGGSCAPRRPIPTTRPGRRLTTQWRCCVALGDERYSFH
jgi:peroxiredoxin